MRTLAPDRPQPHHAWLTLIGLSAISSLLISGPLVSLAVFIPVLRQVEGWSDSALGGAASALLLCMSLACIVSGALCDKFSPRLVILGGGVLTTLGCIFASRAQTPTSFVEAYIAIGTGIGLSAIVPSIAVLSRAFPDRRGMALGIYFASIALVSACFPTLSNMLIDMLGWRGALMVVSGLIALSLPLALFIQQAPKSGATAPDGTPSGDSLPGLSARSALMSPKYWLLTAAVTLASVNAQAVLFAFVAFLVESGLTLGKATGIYSVANLCAVPAMFVAGMAADRWGARNVLSIAVVLQCIGTFALLGVATPGPLGFFAVVLFCIGWGMTSGVVSQLGPILLGDLIGPRHFSAVLGIMTAVAGLISATSPMGTALLREHGFSEVLVFQGLGIVCLLVVPLIYLAMSGKHRAAWSASPT